jgi:Fe-S-cluster containining protein
MLDAQDLERLSVHYRRHNVVDIGSASVPSLHLVETPHADGWACVAFRGRVGGPCSCHIYVNRPVVCREFKYGSDRCLEARQDYFDRLSQNEPSRP